MLIADMSLLDYLAWRAGCDYLSDLRSLSRAQRLRLAQALEAIPAEAASPNEWTDALDYLTGRNADGAAQSRAKLIEHLSGSPVPGGCGRWSVR